MAIEITEKQAVQLITDAQEADTSNQKGRLTVLTAIRSARSVTGGEPLALALERADSFLMTGQERLHRLIQGLPKPLVALDKLPPSSCNELASLSTVGGADVCELLALLEAAQSVAERIDVARGYTVGDTIALQPGESRGTDLAESVSLLALRVRQEARGGVSPHE